MTTYKGHEFHTLLVRGGLDGSKTYELRVPEIKEAIPVTPSDGAAQLASPQKIFQEYQDQQKSGH